MKKTLVLAALALTAAFTGCKKGGDEESREILTYTKTSDTALLLVTFGSTWDDPQKTYVTQIEQFKKEFPKADIFFSFTSKTCINRWLADTGQEFVTPDLYLESFIQKGYKNVYVQSLHVIPGEEFQLLRDHYVKTCYNFQVRDMKPAPAPAILGAPLFASQADVETVGKILVDTFAEQLKKGEAVAFIGHGNPLVDYAHANVPYAEIETWMKNYGKATYGNDNIFVGTVDDPKMLLDYVIESITAAGFPKDKTVNLHPLMTIAGDHANNDMAGDEDSWATELKANGWSKINPVFKGLGDYPAINKIWIDHLKYAIAHPAEGH
jgi:sirohydrochlorin cobaltochelatase